MKHTPKLRAVKHDLKTKCWCGPAALSSVTGLPTSLTVDLLKQVSGRRMIKGVSNYHMFAALGRCGLRVKQVYGTMGQTLAAWLKTRDDPKAVYLVNVTHHYVVVQGRKAVDNHTIEPRFLRKFPHRRKRVVRAWKVQAVTD